MTNARDNGERKHQVGDFSWMNEVPGKKSFWQKAKEDPLVPIGCGVTLAVLLGGLVTFQRGQSKLGNKFMQARVVAQTGTVLAMSAGGFLAATKKEETKKQSYEERLNIELRDVDKYLLRKCRSEQQLMNELTKLIDSKDYESTTNVVVLHRLCRAIQFTAECLDGAVLQMTGSAHQPQFLDKITERVVEFASHSNPFIACESLRALVWLLPRLSSNAPSGWELLMSRLMEISVDQISPEPRVAIAEAFFHRTVTNPSLNQHQIDTELLKKCLVVTLSWFKTSPCEWHAAMLVRIWQTALRKSLGTTGDDVFCSINAVLDFQHHHLHLKTTTELVKRSTLDFLYRMGAKFAVHQSSWFRALSLRLTKQMLLESLISRRLSVQVMSQLSREAQQLGKADIVQQLAVLMAYLKQTDPGDAENSNSNQQSAQAFKR